MAYTCRWLSGMVLRVCEKRRTAQKTYSVQYSSSNPYRRSNRHSKLQRWSCVADSNSRYNAGGRVCGIRNTTQHSGRCCCCCCWRVYSVAAGNWVKPLYSATLRKPTSIVQCEDLVERPTRLLIITRSQAVARIADRNASQQSIWQLAIVAK